jgi:ketosteroid isomerase-like protein
VSAIVEVQAAADALIGAFAEGRLDDYFGAFAPDASFLFHTTERRLASVADYRALWDGWVRQDAFRVLSCVSTDQLIQVFGDTAVFTHNVCTRVADRTAEQTLLERETIVFRLIDGRWLAVHEHLSPDPSA